MASWKQRRKAETETKVIGTEVLTLAANNELQ